MSDSRAQTLAALDAFLDAQTALLARTQADLHKLSQLRERALAEPEEFLENIQQDLDDPAFKLSQYDLPPRPGNIDWDLFTSFDPSPFAKIPLPGPPPLSAATKQRSAPSELQNVVREASKTILADFTPFAPNDDDDEAADADADAEDEQRLAELVKSGKNKSKKYHGPELDVDEPQLQPRVGSRLRLKPSRETIMAEAGADKGKGRLAARNKARAVVEPQSASLSTSSLLERPKRSRRPTARPDENRPLPQPPPPEPSLPSPSDAVIGPDTPVHITGPNDASDSESSMSLASVGGTSHSRAKKKVKRQDSRRNKAPSETFNLPWSLSEQHLLEKLLEEIPAGEKQRWAKISKAMAGRRTARQVASRVQKYFEKLKKFGLGDVAS